MLLVCIVVLLAMITLDSLHWTWKDRKIALIIFLALFYLICIGWWGWRIGYDEGYRQMGSELKRLNKLVEYQKSAIKTLNIELDTRRTR